MNVLLVEDDEPNRALVAGRLRYLGHEVTEARGLLDGMAALKNGQFDVAILDLHLDGHLKHGVALLTWISRHPALSRLPVIIHSAQDVLGHELALGGLAVAFLPKPHTKDQLAQALARLQP